MKSPTLLLLFSLLTLGHAQSQNTKGGMALYNIGLGSVVSGIGALINKKKGERWEKVLLKGIGQGALGGYFVYESKNLLSNVSKKERWGYSWGAKFANAAGTSIIANASSNRNFWEQWHFNIGFNRFELHTKDRFRLKYKIMPVSLVLTASVAIGNKFELGRSLQTGEFIFSTSRTAGSNRGRAYANVILIREPFFDAYDLYTHEIIHIYQYYDYNFVNTYMNKPYTRWEQKSKGFAGFRNIFHIDLNGFVVWPAYFIQEGPRNYNSFENEADFWQH